MERKNSMKKYIQFLVSALVFFLPWQTIYITREQFLQDVKFQYGTLGFYATEILLWVCVFFFMWRIYQNKKHAPQQILFSWTKDRLFLFAILLFCLFSFGSIVWSLDAPLALQQSLRILEAMLLFIILVFGSVDFSKVTKWFIAGGVVQSVLGIYQFLSQSTFSYKWLGLVAHPVAQAGTSVIVGDGVGRVMRAYGAFAHPNILGGYLCITLVFTTFLFLKEYKKHWFYIVLYSICFSLQFMALFFTWSRSAWIATVLFFLGVCVYSIKNKIRESLLILCSLLLCIPVAIWYAPLLHVRVAHESAHEIRSTQERMVGYSQALSLWKGAALFGVGAGNYTTASYVMNPALPGYVYQPVHSVPLLIITEFGIIGCMLLFGIGSRFYTLVYQNSSRKYQGLFLSGILVVLSLFDHYLYSSYVGILLVSLYFAFVSHFLLSRE